MLGGHGAESTLLVCWRAIGSRASERAADHDSQNVTNPSRRGAGNNIQTRDGHGEPEAPRAGAARVYVQHAVLFPDVGLVGVSGDNDLQSRLDGIDVQLLQVVQHMYGNTACIQRQLRRNRPRPGVAVVVASDGVDGSDLPKGGQNLLATDIPGVDDSLHTLQSLDRLGAQETVGV